MVNKKIYGIFLFILISISIISAGELRVNSITLPDKLNTESSYQVNVSIESIDWEGLIIVKTLTEGSFSVSPSSENVQLNGKQNLKFNIGTGFNEGIGKLTIEICDINQFSGPSTCDDKSVSFMIIKEEEKKSNLGLYILIGLLIIVIIFLVIKNLTNKKSRR